MASTTASTGGVRLRAMAKRSGWADDCSLVIVAIPVIVRPSRTARQAEQLEMIATEQLRVGRSGVFRTDVIVIVA
jgi:CTP-dependent riboflavin kinase